MLLPRRLAEAWRPIILNSSRRAGRLSYLLPALYKPAARRYHTAMTQALPQSRRTVLTAVLFGVLILSVGVALLLTHYRPTATGEGTLVVRDMWTRTLPAFWPAATWERVFLAHDDAGRPQERLTVVRRATADGFQGKRIHEILTPRRGRTWSRVVEAWSVRSDLSAGLYTATYNNGELVVEIVLREGEVVFRADNTEFPPAAPPGNYLPEGLEWLAVRLVAAGGKKATFAMITNEYSRAAGGIRFDYVTMTPVNSREVRCRYDVAGQSHTETFHLDASGEVVQMDRDTGESLRPAPATGPDAEGPDAGRPDTVTPADRF